MRTPGVLPQYKSIQITVYVRTKDGENMKLWAQKLEVSMSKFMRDAVDYYIEHLKNEEIRKNWPTMTREDMITFDKPKSKKKGK